MGWVNVCCQNGSAPGFREVSVPSIDSGLLALADHLKLRRDDILLAWRNAIKGGSDSTSSAPLPFTDLYDHIPALLSTFERQLRSSTAAAAKQHGEAGHVHAAAHGLQRWQQGYDLREVTRELGKLNELVVAELENYRPVDVDATREGSRMWAALCGTGIEESVAQFFELQQQEAAGHVKDLETALENIQELEKQRADLWRQAAHDLRGNLGVVANVTVGLSQGGLREPVRDTFVRILMRNVTSLHHLLNDVTDLARLQAGTESRRVELVDVSNLLQQLCEGISALAQERHLFLRCDGPEGFAIEGDEVKIRRIAQNLILNAVKFTPAGGITVSWGDSGSNDPKRWELRISDTGPGLHSGSDKPLMQALEKAQQQAEDVKHGDTDARHGDTDARHGEAGAKHGDAGAGVPGPLAAAANHHTSGPVHLARDATGEGLGLSIVKRLCDLLDATIEVTSESGAGTTFRILLPRHYA
jgi:signal transduction histidine kinase